MNLDIPALLDRLGAIVGPANLLTGGDAAARLAEWRGLWAGECLALTRPGSTAEVAALMRLCAANALAVVPRGGNTGLVGGQVPMSDRAVAICLDRMSRIGAADRSAGTIRAEAGATLAAVRQAAAEAGMLFPVSLAAEGTAQIGGTIATNAGGTAVLAHGSMRAQVLGLEVVLPDGRIWDGMRALRKDNTGYDLKQLFIGSEGTLGIVTAAVLRLVPAPRDHATVWLSLETPEQALEILSRLSAALGPGLTTFELISAGALDVLRDHDPSRQPPVEAEGAWHVLAEASVFGAQDSDALVLPVLETLLEEGIALDAALASSLAQRQALWALREDLTETQSRAGAQIKHDISLPLAAIPAFLERAGAALRERMPGVRIVPFGHLGDGNLHYNLLAPRGEDDGFRARSAALSTLVHDLVLELGGSISAEHGIGRLKRDEMGQIKSAVELDLMHRLKAALDPEGRLNPGVMLPEVPSHG